MRRLINNLSARLRRLRGEEGISLIFVTLSLVVLIGMVAFAVDTGALYQERRELQSGADAAAFAIAEDCALGTKPCTQTQADATADAYADANASDAEAGVDNVDLDLTNKIVEVDVSTETTTGGTIFQPFFARVLGFNGTNVDAEAAVQWGFASGLGTIPIVISFCEMEEYLYPSDPAFPRILDGEWRPTDPVLEPWGEGLHGLGEPDNPEPAATMPWQGADPVVIVFHGGPGANECNAVAGQDQDGDGKLPGGFGWVKDDLNDCFVESEDDWVDESPGAPPPPGCSQSDLIDLMYQKTVLIPWFQDVNNLGGANGKYLIEGYIGFYVTSFRFPSAKSPGPAACSGPDFCIEGYFKVAQSDSGDIGGDQGVIVVKFIK